MAEERLDARPCGSATWPTSVTSASPTTLEMPLRLDAPDPIGAALRRIPGRHDRVYGHAHARAGANSSTCAACTAPARPIGVGGGAATTRAAGKPRTDEPVPSCRLGRPVSSARRSMSAAPSAPATLSRGPPSSSRPTRRHWSSPAGRPRSTRPALLILIMARSPTRMGPARSAPSPRPDHASRSMRHKLEGIANEMQATLLRRSFSPIVKEGLDASAACSPSTARPWRRPAPSRSTSPR